MTTVSLTVNGKPVTANVDPRTLLVQFLRENLRLTGTHVGCDTSQCGACVVHLDGKAVKSCTLLAVMADGHEVTGSVEGGIDGRTGHAGLQCSRWIGSSGQARRRRRRTAGALRTRLRGRHR